MPTGGTARRRPNLTEFTLISLLAETVALTTIASLLPDLMRQGNTRALIFALGALLVILSFCLWSRLALAQANPAPTEAPTGWELKERKFIPLIFLLAGVLFSGLSFTMGDQDKPDVISFAVLEPRRLSHADDARAASGILQLQPNVQTSSLDVKLYIKLGPDTRWYLTDTSLECFATIRSKSWAIPSHCVRFDSAFNTFTVVAVLVDENSVSDLPGFVQPHYVEAIDFADLKAEVLPIVHDRDPSSISLPVEIKREALVVSVFTLTGTPTSTITPTPITATRTLTTPTFTPSYASTTVKPTPTFTRRLTATRSPTSTATPFPLLSSVIIDNEETQQERRADGKDHYRLLRWREWTQTAPDGWFYVIRFVPASDVNLVSHAVIVPPEAAQPGQGENEGWLTYSFDILNLPHTESSCYPYWDVIVAIDVDRVNCLPEERAWQGICRLSEFSRIQQALATAPPGACTEAGSTGSRPGSSEDPGHLPFDP